MQEATIMWSDVIIICYFFEGWYQEASTDEGGQTHFGSVVLLLSFLSGAIAIPSCSQVVKALFCLSPRE